MSQLRLVRGAPAVLAVLAAAACGCSSDSEGPESTAPAERMSVSEAIITYVDLLDRGDLDSASAMFCGGFDPIGGQDATIGVPLLKSDLGGHLQVAEVEELSRDGDLVTAAVTMRGSEYPFHLVLSSARPRLRLCYQVQPVRLERPSVGVSGQAGTSVEAIEDLSPAGFVRVPDESERSDHPEDFEGYVGSHRVAFADPKAGRPLVTVTAYDFDSEDHAVRASMTVQAQVDRTAIRDLDVRVRGSRAFRYLTFHRLLVQPRDRGWVSDFAYVRLGNRLWTVYVAGLEPDARSTLMESTVERIADVEPALSG